MTLSSAALRAAKDGWAVGPVEAPAVLRATGKDAKDYLHRMTTQDLNALPPGGSAYAAVLNAKGHLLADLHALVEADGVLLIMDPRGAADAEGQARFGAEMDASRLPMEAGLTRLAISFSKGCYTGQEVVLRATSRGHLQRGLERSRGAPQIVR